MAQHININLLERDFFVEPKREIIKQILNDVDKVKNGIKPIKYNIKQLPDEYLWEVTKEDGYTPYFTIGIKCNPEYVIGGKCTIEIHYKSQTEYLMYVVA